MVLSIFTVVMGIAYTAISLNETYRDLVLTKIQLYRQNKKAVDNICAELQRSSADNWTMVDGGGGNPDTIQFQIPWTIDATYNEHWGADNTDGFSIRYRLVNNDLIREILDTGQSVTWSAITAENITNLQFTSIGTNYIRINIGSQRKTFRGWTINSDLESTVFLRN